MKHGFPPLKGVQGDDLLHSDWLALTNLVIATLALNSRIQRNYVQAFCRLSNSTYFPQIPQINANVEKTHLRTSA